MFSANVNVTITLKGVKTYLYVCFSFSGVGNMRMINSTLRNGKYYQILQRLAVS